MSAGPYVDDVTLNPKPDSEGVWTLELRLQLGRGILSDTLKLGLDRVLRAVPPSADLSRTLTVSSKAGVSVAGVDPGVRVSANLREVEARLPRRLRGSRGMVVRVEVAWADSVLHPPEIHFEALFTYLGWPVNRQELTLLNVRGPAAVRANLLSVLTTPDRRFYFPDSPKVVPLTYNDFSPMTGPVQSLPGSTVWGTMWPSELSFWHSSEGCEFLVRQWARFVETSERARRIAIMPEPSTLTPAMRLMYLAELEVHHQLGVEVRLMPAAELRHELGDVAEAMLCLGDTLGVYYGGIHLPVSNATAGLLLDRDGIRDLREVYADIQPRGIRWTTSHLREELLRAPLARPLILSRLRALQQIRPTHHIGAPAPKESVPCPTAASTSTNTRSSTRSLRADPAPHS